MLVLAFYKRNKCNVRIRIKKNKINLNAEKGVLTLRALYPLEETYQGCGGDCKTMAPTQLGYAVRIFLVQALSNREQMVERLLGSFCHLCHYTVFTQRNDHPSEA